MPSLGFLGAIGGAAEGFNKGIQQQIEEARATRIEQLRAQNQQELFRQNNQQRHDFSLAEIKQQDEFARERIGLQSATHRADKTWELENRDQYDLETLDDGTLVSRNLSTHDRKVLGSKRSAADKGPLVRDFEEQDEFGNSRRVPKQLVTGEDGIVRYVDIDKFDEYPPAPKDPSQRIKDKQYRAVGGALVTWDGQGWLSGNSPPPQSRAPTAPTAPTATPPLRQPAPGASRPDPQAASPPPSSRAAPDIVETTSGTYGNTGNLPAGVALDNAVGVPARAVGSAVSGVLSSVRDSVNESTSYQKYRSLRAQRVPFERMPKDVLMAAMNHVSPEEKRQIAAALKMLAGKN